MWEYKDFIDHVKKKYGIDLNLYKEAQMKRRLTSLRNKRNFDNFRTYFQAIEEDAELLEEFFDRITINVSEFYRNPKRWDILRDNILPKLVQNKSSINIWSAACSSGEEPYSLAILFKEHFPHINLSILATDIDEKILEKAKQGIYAPNALKDLPIHKKSKYFKHENGLYYVLDDLKRNITFRKHDLLKERYPTNIDLIVCRNVLIYFTDEAKDLIYKGLSEALTEEGVLFIGSTEQIFNPNQYNLSSLDTFFYQKKSEIKL